MAELGSAYITVVPVFKQGSQKAVAGMAQKAGKAYTQSFSKNVAIQSALAKSLNRVGLKGASAQWAVGIGNSIGTATTNSLTRALTGSKGALSKAMTSVGNGLKPITSALSNGLSKAMSSVANSKVFSTIGRGMTPITSALSSRFSGIASTFTSNLSSGMTSAASNFGSLLATLGKGGVIGLAVAGAASVAAPLVAATKMGWTRLTTLDTASARLKAMGQSGAQIEATLEAAKQSVLGTPYPLNEAADAMSMLVAAGGKLNDGFKGADATLKSLVNASALGGNTSLKELTDVFQTVQIQGRVTGLELKRFAQNNVPAISALAKSFNVTEDSIREMASNGEISLAHLNKALSEYSEDAALEFGRTLPGRISNFKASLGRLGEEMWKPLYDGLKDDEGAFATMTKWIDGLANTFDFSFIGKAADSVVNSVIGTIDRLYVWLDANDIPTTIVNNVTDFIERLDFEQIGVKAGEMLSTLGDVASAAKSVANFINKLTGNTPEADKNRREQQIIESKPEYSSAYAHGYKPTFTQKEQEYIETGAVSGKNLTSQAQELTAMYHDKGQVAGEAWNKGLAEGNKKSSPYTQKTFKEQLNTLYDPKQVDAKGATKVGQLWAQNTSNGITKGQNKISQSAQTAVNKTTSVNTQSGAKVGTAWDIKTGSAIVGNANKVLQGAQTAVDKTAQASTKSAQQKGAEIPGKIQAGINGQPTPNANVTITGKGVLDATAQKILALTGGKSYGVLTLGLNTLAGNITKSAKGGVFSSPRVSLFGEDGTEAIVPLEKNKEWIGRVSADFYQSFASRGMIGAGAGGGNVYINNAQVNNDAQIRASVTGLLNTLGRKGMM